MGDIYGEHWGSILSALAVSWGKTTELEENEHEVDRYVFHHSHTLLPVSILSRLVITIQ